MATLNDPGLNAGHGGDEARDANATAHRNGGAPGSRIPPKQPALLERMRRTAHFWRIRMVTFAERRTLHEQLTGPPLRATRALRRMTLLWRGARKKLRPQVWLALGLTLGLAAVLVGTAVEFVFGVTLPVHVNAGCARHEFGCGALGGILVTAFAAAVAFTWLILVRVFQVVNWGYARSARKTPSGFVPTAADIAEVVGRDDLCRVIEKELRDRSSRRPQVIVGGVGAGKTAVLVRLTQWLAERGAVPVAVRLRDLKEDESFRDLAWKRFRSVNEKRFASDAEADRIWRRLSGNGVIVLLADGLEEAFTGTEARETSIRQSIEEARRLDLPLVITSRPDDALVTLDAALVELGPLDEEDAFQYVLRSRTRKDAPRLEEVTLRKLMSTAKVAEMPLYLQLTRDLYARDLLEVAHMERLLPEHRLETRLLLLDRWRACIVDGQLKRDVSITRDRRQDAIEVLSAVAAAALLLDTLELKFKLLKGDGEQEDFVHVDPTQARVASNLGARLEIVETLRAGVRFRHSIMQAYLGSRWISQHALTRENVDEFEDLTRPNYLREGIRNGGREFVMALTMACHARVATTEHALDPHRQHVLEEVSKRLAAEAQARSAGGDITSARSVLLLAAAYEIYRMVSEDPARCLNQSQKPLWPPDLDGGRRLTESKQMAIDRVAESKVASAYTALYQTCLVERDYRVRLAAAQHLASGGDVAAKAIYEALRAAVKQLRRASDEGFAVVYGRDARGLLVQGWILPLLAATADEMRDRVLDLFDEWAVLCSSASPLLEASLAQGLKYEANRVPVPGGDLSARSHLVRVADELLERTDWWYTRLTLLQAMTLWMLPSDPRSSDDRLRRIMRWAGSDPHPFVRTAADLCASALATRNPSRYIWIDETGVAAKLGQRQKSGVVDVSGTSLWLNESLGWVALKPRALRLVGDVLLMLNLADGTQRYGLPNGDHAVVSGQGTADADPERADEQFRRALRACKPGLPPCITRGADRAWLSIAQGEDERSWALPSIMCGGSCPFLLCPYPVAGQTWRPEFSESFCRGLATVKGRSEWHSMRKRTLHEFWRDMERRVRAG